MKAESKLAPHLRLDAQASLDPVERQKYEQAYYDLYERQGIEQAKANLYANGQYPTSFAGAQVAQLEGGANLNRYLAGLERQQMDFNNTLAARGSLGLRGVDIAQAQNAADVNRGLGVAQLEYGLSGDRNRYNLAANQGLNSFNMSNYANQMQGYGMDLQAQANRAQGIGGLALGVGKLFAPAVSPITGFLRGVFGGGGGGGGSSATPLIGGAGPILQQPFAGGLPAFAWQTGPK